MPQIVAKWGGSICDRCGQRIDKGDLLYPESRRDLEGRKVTVWMHVYCPDTGPVVLTQDNPSEYTKAFLTFALDPDFG